jgi:hypothetical protein
MFLAYSFDMGNGRIDEISQCGILKQEGEIKYGKTCCPSTEG